MHALAGRDPFIAARAAAVLRCVLDGNPAGKVYLRIALTDMLMLIDITSFLKLHSLLEASCC